MFYSAFLMGLLGSLHCLGMCGPLVLALPVQGSDRFRALTARLVYNAGRISTYTILGLLMGIFGQGLTWFTSQQQLSIAIGVGMLLLVVLPGRVSQRFNMVTPIARFTTNVKRQFSHHFKQRSYRAFFFSGILNGLLPCGLVYMALAGAMATGKDYSGAAYMVLFGLGTLPMMVAVSLAGQYITLQWRSQFTRFVPVFTIGLAFLFILRGLNIGIPMLSPAAEKSTKGATLKCCHKK